MDTTPSKGPRIAIMGGVAVLAIAVIVYFSFFYPPTKNEDAAGTIGAAKKYQSEQITDKDVKLGGAQTEAAATSESIVDEAAAKEYASAAAAFENAFKDFNSRAHFGQKFIAQSKATAAAMNKIAEYAARAPKGSYDKNSVAGLYQMAAELSARAKGGDFNKASGEISAKAGGTAYNQAVMEMRAGMSTLSQKANAVELSMRSSLDNRTTYGNKELGSRPLESKALENKVMGSKPMESKPLENKPLEKNQMENQQSLDNRPKQ